MHEPWHLACANSSDRAHECVHSHDWRTVYWPREGGPQVRQKDWCPWGLFRTKPDRGSHKTVWTRAWWGKKKTQLLCDKSMIHSLHRLATMIGRRWRLYMLALPRNALSAAGIPCYQRPYIHRSFDTTTDRQRLMRQFYMPQPIWLMVLTEFLRLASLCH